MRVLNGCWRRCTRWLKSDCIAVMTPAGAGGCTAQRQRSKCGMQLCESMRLHKLLTQRSRRRKLEEKGDKSGGDHRGPICFRQYSFHLEKVQIPQIDQLVDQPPEAMIEWLCSLPRSCVCVWGHHQNLWRWSVDQAAPGPGKAPNAQACLPSMYRPGTHSKEEVCITRDACLPFINFSTVCSSVCSWHGLLDCYRYSAHAFIPLW